MSTSRAYTAGQKNAVYEGDVPDPHLFEEKLTEDQAPIAKNSLYGGESHKIQLVTIMVDNNNQAATPVQ